ncbi:hypothetical protein SAMN04488134_10346 [Amphibacillus marinus]|uniref:Uncharacterized protein n=1 Tax=Amphibacillus marinus TaxID=872970 RepID=A0A1H8L1J5_9BACI|nr:hypothetical protein [Amphibacillus marinus]SEN98997.1 hypothetical protein SAMN04488134_10346 [Amphibacillus marinus]
MFIIFAPLGLLLIIKFKTHSRAQKAFIWGYAIIFLFALIYFAFFDETDRNIEISLAASIKGEQLIFSGETNLIDGAIIAFEIENLDANHFFLEGATQVRNGKFQEVVYLENFLSGEIHVWVVFSPDYYNDEQPLVVIDQYGARGELLEGDNVKTYDKISYVDTYQTLNYQTELGIITSGVADQNIISSLDRYTIENLIEELAVINWPDDQFQQEEEIRSQLKAYRSMAALTIENEAEA